MNSTFVTFIQSASTTFVFKSTKSLQHCSTVAWRNFIQVVSYPIILEVANLNSVIKYTFLWSLSDSWEMGRNAEVYHSPVHNRVPPSIPKTYRPSPRN